MYYKTGYCFTPKDLFETMNLRVLGIKRDYYRGEGKSEGLTYFVCKVFLYYMYLVLMDIIENNVTFCLPLKGNRSASIYVKVFDGDDFQKLYSAGKFTGIDFLNSMFKGYQIFYRYNCKSGDKEKPIYINNKLKDKFYSYINEGKIYY